MSRDNDQMFDRGQTYYGPDRTIDTANLLGASLEGQEKTFEDLDYGSTSGSGVTPARSGRKVVCRLVRNYSGITLYAKQLCNLNEAGTRLTGLATVDSSDAFPVDEFVPSGGVRHGDLCWVVVEGPAMCQTAYTGGAFNGDIAAGDKLHSVTASAGTTAAGTTSAAGRVAGFTVVAATTAGQFTSLKNYLQNYLGQALTARTTGNTNADILVDVRRRR